MMHFSQACRRTIAGANPNNINMAQLSDRFLLNVPGAWYNDTSCIDCGLCPEIAPGISGATMRTDKCSSGTSRNQKPNSRSRGRRNKRAQRRALETTEQTLNHSNEVQDAES